MEGILAPVAALLTALLISAIVIPLTMPLAPRFGMIDLPGVRKVHSRPIPRVGGFGIVAGAIAAIGLFAPLNAFAFAFVGGMLILAIFGGWDDLRELGHYPKFAGQIAAAVVVVWTGDVWISQLPFLDATLPAFLGKPFSVIVIVGIINAINHSDGLDGLAGGESLLSLGAMCCLAYLTGNLRILIFAASIGGGLLGFMRFNTYPAKVFMGDMGSQSLGFSVGVLAILLTQEAHSPLGKSLALLIVGLPVADILTVLYQRIQGRMHWFRATRNHLHHRLLDLNFNHDQAVLILYSVQALLTLVAVVLAYEAEALIVTVYLLVCGTLLTGLALAERRGWQINRIEGSRASLFFRVIDERSALSRGPLIFVQISVPLYLIVTGIRLQESAAVESVGTFALLLLLCLTALIVLGPHRWPTAYRMTLYSAIGILGYCIYALPGATEGFTEIGAATYFLLLALAIFWAASSSRRDDLFVSNLDFLLVTALIAAAWFTRQIFGSSNFWNVAIEITILLYGCELIIVRGGRLWNRILSTSALGALGMIVANLR